MHHSEAEVATYTKAVFMALSRSCHWTMKTVESDVIGNGSITFETHHFQLGQPSQLRRLIRAHRRLHANLLFLLSAP